MTSGPINTHNQTLILTIMSRSHALATPKVPFPFHTPTIHDTLIETQMNMIQVYAIIVGNLITWFLIADLIEELNVIPVKSMATKLVYATAMRSNYLTTKPR